MKCIAGTPLSAESLFAALDGEATLEQLTHLDQCAYCQERMDELLNFEDRMKTAAMQHPTAQMLLNFHFGFLAQETADTLQHHLSQCIPCQKILAEYQQESKLATSKPKPIAWFPTTTRKRLPSDWIAPTHLKGPEFSGVTLLGTADTRVLGSEEPRAIAANSPGTSLFLSIEKNTDGSFTLAGHIVAEEQITWEGAIAALLLQEELQTMVFVNELGQFTFSSVSQGTYRLRVRAATSETLIFESLIIA
jgi:hypothetical protein